MQSLNNIYSLIIELNKLKSVFRTTTINPERRESTAEHSWSVAMITMTLMDELKKEFGAIDETKAIKLSLVHDVVEIYAGDVIAFDLEARKAKHNDEIEALKKLAAIYPEFGEQLSALWYEFEEKTSLEAKIAKASDSICPIFLRFQSQQSYAPLNLTIANLEETKYPHFAFSKTYTALYQKLKADLLAAKFITM